MRKLVEYLNNNKNSSGEERIFLVSSITVAEMVTNEDDSEKIKRIMRVLNAKNTEFVDFDIEVALAFNIQLKNCLNKEHLHKRALEIGFTSKEFALAREWITKDYMIAMSGIVNKSDVILTADKNTFHPIIKDVPNSNCVITYPELFEQSDMFILKYKEEEVSNFLNKKKMAANKSNGKEDSKTNKKEPIQKESP